jgi:hypothetical protein
MKMMLDAGYSTPVGNPAFAGMLDALDTGCWLPDNGCYIIRFIGRYKRAFGRCYKSGILYKS